MYDLFSEQCTKGQSMHEIEQNEYAPPLATHEPWEPIPITVNKEHCEQVLKQYSEYLWNTFRIKVAIEQLDSGLPTTKLSSDLARYEADLKDYEDRYANFVREIRQKLALLPDFHRDAFGTPNQFPDLPAAFYTLEGAAKRHELSRNLYELYALIPALGSYTSDIFNMHNSIENAKDALKQQAGNGDGEYYTKILERFAHLIRFYDNVYNFYKRFCAQLKDVLPKSVKSIEVIPCFNEHRPSVRNGINPAILVYSPILPTTWLLRITLSRFKVALQDGNNGVLYAGDTVLEFPFFHCSRKETRAAKLSIRDCSEVFIYSEIPDYHGVYLTKHTCDNSLIVARHKIFGYSTPHTYEEKKQCLGTYVTPFDKAIEPFAQRFCRAGFYDTKASQTRAINECVTLFTDIFIDLMGTITLFNPDSVLRRPLDLLSHHFPKQIAMNFHFAKFDVQYATPQRYWEYLDGSDYRWNIGKIIAFLNTPYSEMLSLLENNRHKDSIVHVLSNYSEGAYRRIIWELEEIESPLEYRVVADIDDISEIFEVYIRISEYEAVMHLENFNKYLNNEALREGMDNDFTNWKERIEKLQKEYAEKCDEYEEYWRRENGEDDYEEAYDDEDQL